MPDTPTRKGNLRVAVAQVASNSTDTLEENAKKHADWIDMAGKEGARAILFPELSMSKFFFFFFFFFFLLVLSDFNFFFLTISSHITISVQLATLRRAW